MLVLDFADDGFEQILDGEDAISAAIFVDDDGHVDALLLHLLQQIAHRRRGRHEQHLAHQVEFADLAAERGGHQLDRSFLGGLIQRLHFDNAAERVLDVDEAGNVIKIVIVDRNAGMADLAEARQQHAQCLGRLHRHDIGARHHDVVDALVAELEDILQDGALGLGEVGRFGAAFALEGDFEVIAQRHGPQRQKRLDAVPDRWPPRRRGGGTR